MLQLHYIQQNPQEVIERLKTKNFDANDLVAQLLKTDEARRQNQVALDALLQQSNSVSKEIGVLMGQGKKEEAEQKKQEVAKNKQAIADLEQHKRKLEEEQKDLLVKLPNTPNALVPKGKTPEDNVKVRGGGEPIPQPNAKPHWEIAKQFNIIDFELGVKITGAGFPVYIGKGAQLQRALISFFLEEANIKGYKEIQPPLMVNADSGFGTGQLPDKEGQMYHVTEDGFYMIPTSEVPVTNIYRDEIVAEKDLPIKMTAYSQCFRREAGSYGKDVRGLNRLHQFDKVEIVQIAHPTKSYEVLDEMVEHVESLVQALGLTYRILRLCGGDMSFASALTYDFECYSPAQDKWLEVSSVSNFETFQSNRMKLRYRDANNKTQLAHTLNGSALALPRIVASILETHQKADGSVELPTVLHKYLGWNKIS
jgi:seryl-tRNA synthetase